MNGRRGIAGCGVRRDAVVKAECGAPTAITAPRARACPLRPLFAAALLVLSGALALPAAAQTMTDPVWSATMTAGDTRVGHGYDATDTPAIGALDDDDFNYGSLPYRVLAIDVATNVVRFAVEPGGQLADETLTLEFGGHALAFSDRISVISVGLNLYWLVPAALDDLETEFPVGSTATVCLRTATQVCPTGSIVTPPTDANAAPAFSSSAEFDAAENQTTAGTVLATDSDSEDDVTGYAITGGADQAFFSIGATSGALTFKTAPNFEDAKDSDTGNDYVVEVQATSGTGERVKTATQTITVTVTDVGGEAPGKPDAPDVAPASVSSLTVNWSAPANGGPAITDYDVQYRAGTTGDWSDGGHTGTATTATLSSLSENTSYQVQVRATSDEGTGSWSDSGSGTTDANAAPAFSSSATFDAAENQTTAGAVLATDSDTDDDVTGYAITGGADQAFFSIGATSGALTFDAAPNFEDAKDSDTGNDYVVEVQATSGTGERVKTATQTITVTVTDVAGEAPGKPDAPTVAPASVTSLTVNWSAPANAGPAITDYDVQYRAGTSGSWSDGGHTGTATTATLSSLSENTSYQVQVRATSDEGTGSWSDSGTGLTDANAAPTFSSSATFGAAENQTAAGTVLATDGDTGDDVTGYAITGGADQNLFSIGATSGALTFDAAPNFEDAKDSDTGNDYVVEVQATSGTGERVKTATQTITVTVTDVGGEAPGKPDAPDVAPASVTSLTVNWSAPANGGPAITDYDVQYRAGTTGDWSDGGHTGTATTATLSSLSENTSYQVQVRATNDEGTGSWSDSGSGATDANAAPAFSSSATFDAAENQTTAGAVLATDSDTDDDVTGYAITGGADQAFFSIGATSGALTFDAAPNFEDAKDSDTGNNYVVEVQATSGTGERVKTATQTITVAVTDVGGEAPGKPDAPTVSAASVTSLTVNWSAPANGGPAITDYDVQYRAGTSGSWSDGGHTGTATTATLTGLSENTSYQVQVRARSDEGTGSWSDSGSGTTDANAAPAFSSSATFDAAENQTTAGTVLATDSDSEDDVTGYAITGGADQAFFSIGVTSGALTFDTAPNFEDAKDQGTGNDYVVEVQATSGAGERVKTATQTITVTVTDVGGEAPGKPDAPTVAPASVSSLTVNWSAPANAGPAITDYDVQYRVGTSGSWSDGGHTGTATTATLSSLSENTSYQVQVRATSDEGTGSWSDSGTGTTDANAAPGVTLALSDDSIGENGGVSTVTATVSPASAAAFTVTVAAAAVSPAVAADFRLSANTVLSFAENATTSTGSVTITGVDNDVDAADKTVTVSGTVSATSVTAPPNRTLTLEDDDAAGVTVSVTALTVTEQDATGDSYTVVLDTEPTHEVTVTVGGHSGTDVSLSSSTLTFTPSNWDRAQTVTVKALNDDDTANDAVTLTHTATSTDGNYSGIAIAGVSVTVTDNDTTTPAVTLVLSPGSIGENGGLSTVTATVSPASPVDFTVTISASPVAPATEDDFELSTNKVLSFAENATESTGTVTIRPVGDDDPEPDDDVTVSGAVSNAAIPDPDDVTLTIRNDDAVIVPGTPKGLQAAAKSQTRIQLSWTAPADVGSFAITGYRIEVSENAGSRWNVLKGHTGNTRVDYAHTRLSAGDTRHYRVSAISAAGTSRPSGVASATTISSAGPVATNSALPPPQDVRADPKLPGEILLSWWRNPNAESKDLVDHHQYRYRVRGANNWIKNWTDVAQTLIPNTNPPEIRNNNSVLVEDLDAETTYEFQVRSVDKDDTYSAAVSALGTATGPQTISIARPSGTVTEGDPLRFTLWRDKPHGTLDVAVRFSETGNMLQPDRRGRNWFSKIVRFGDGNATIPVVVETVDDGDASEPDSRVTAEVKQAYFHPHGYLYEVHPSRGSATKTVTARGGTTRSAALSVADAEATEGEDATLDFLVRLDGNPGSDVTVDYGTRDGTATAGSDYTETSGTLTFEPGEDEKTVSVPIADDDVEDDGETFTLMLSNASGAGVANDDYEATGTIRNSETTGPAELTASFVGVPEAHDGESAFHFGDVTIAGGGPRVCDVRCDLEGGQPAAARSGGRLGAAGADRSRASGSGRVPLPRFSEDIGISFRALREDAFTVTGGRVTGGSRVDGRRDLFKMTVRPDADGDVTITLPAGRECATSGAICTKGENRRQLTNSPSATVAGPVGISVADARVEEGAGAVLEFAVTLERAAGGAVTVDYATSDGTAQVGVDYTAANGTLTFEAGESSKTVEVSVLDDSHDEGEETMTLRLSNPSEGRLADAEATGTIENTDPLPRALLARFGRATALHVMEQVEERLEASRAPGLRGRFAGRELRRGMERDMGRNFLSRLQSTAVAGARDTTGVQSDLSGSELLRTGLGGGDLLMGSGFVLNRETGAGASVSLWSRGMESRFSGRDGELSLDGGVRTTMFGADYAKGPLMAGLMLSHRRGLGGYQGADVGQVASSVTGLHPWVGYKLTERVTLWGVTGYGRGSLSLTPGEAMSLPTSVPSPVALKGGLSMSMLAGGVRGDLVDSDAGGFGLAFKADALWVGTGSEAVDGPAGGPKRW